MGFAFAQQHSCAEKLCYQHSEQRWKEEGVPAVGGVTSPRGPQRLGPGGLWPAHRPALAQGCLRNWGASYGTGPGGLTDPVRRLSRTDASLSFCFPSWRRVWRRRKSPITSSPDRPESVAQRFRRVWPAASPSSGNVLET